MLVLSEGRVSELELDRELLRTLGLSCDDREGAEEDMVAVVKLRLGQQAW